ncbi:MAG: N-acetylmuramoyl-L-alanine amidase [Taibaiella sp.]|nr:N-acetylmuramoyl-L-alanine amidase [Taibaiella sp.]
MEALSLFLFKSIVVSGLLTLWYILGLRGRRLHRYNRFYLLSVLFLSITIPFFHFQLFNIPGNIKGGLAPVALLVQAVGNPGSPVASAQVAAAMQFGWQAVACTAAAAVSLLLLLVLLIRIVRVGNMCRRYPVTERDGINLLQIDSPDAPFTFLNYLFWNKAIPLEGEAGRLIYRHELAHIEQGHTYDKLVSQVLTCIFWFNPFYWFIQKELNMVHEFIADEKALESRDTEAFALMLLRSYNNGSYLVPEHHFFSSTVKRRLSMLQCADKLAFARLRQLMALPLIAAAVLLFSCTTGNSVAGDIAPAKKKIVVLVDAAHGGADAGSTAPGYTESEITLAFAKRLKQLAPAYNIEVQLTREADQTVQLADRVAMQNKVRPDVFISLHVGAAPGKEKAKGDFEIYVSGQNQNARKSAACSNGIFQAMTRDGVIPGLPDGCSHDPSKPCVNCAGASPQHTLAATEKDGIYLLKHATVPAMIMELGDINNEPAMKRLMDAGSADLLCNDILKGIVLGAAAQETPAATFTLDYKTGNVTAAQTRCSPPPDCTPAK